MYEHFKKKNLIYKKPNAKRIQNKWEKREEETNNKNEKRGRQNSELSTQKKKTPKPKVANNMNKKKWCQTKKEEMKN